MMEVCAGGFTLEMYSEFLTSRQTVRSSDALTIVVAVEFAGDELIASFDEQLTVRDVRIDA